MGFSCRKSYHLWIEFYFISSFYTLCIILNFFHSKMLNRSDKTVHSCLVPDLKGKEFDFLPLNFMLSVDFPYIPWRASLSLPNFSRVFILRPWWILWIFSALLIWTYFFLFNLFIWWVVLIVPWMLTQSWIDERHLTWCTLHYLFRFLANILLRMCYVCVYENLTLKYILLLCFNWCELDSLHSKWLLYSWINTYFIFIVFSFVFPPPLFLVVSDLTWVLYSVPFYLTPSFIIYSCLNVTFYLMWKIILIVIS